MPKYYNNGQGKSDVFITIKNVRREVLEISSQLNGGMK